MGGGCRVGEGGEGERRIEVFVKNFFFFFGGGGSGRVGSGCGGCGGQGRCERRSEVFVKIILIFFFFFFWGGGGGWVGIFFFFWGGGVWSDGGRVGGVRVDVKKN